MPDYYMTPGGSRVYGEPEDIVVKYGGTVGGLTLIDKPRTYATGTSTPFVGGKTVQSVASIPQPKPPGTFDISPQTPAGSYWRMPEKPEPVGNVGDIFSPEFAKRVWDMQQAAYARGETPNYGLFNFDSPPFRDIKQMPIIGQLPIPGLGLPSIDDMKKYLIYAGLAIGGIYVLGKVLGRKKGGNK